MELEEKKLDSPVTPDAKLSRAIWKKKGLPSRRKGGTLVHHSSTVPRYLPVLKVIYIIIQK